MRRHGLIAALVVAGFGLALHPGSDRPLRAQQQTYRPQSSADPAPGSPSGLTVMQWSPAGRATPAAPTAESPVRARVEPLGRRTIADSREAQVPAGAPARMPQGPPTPPPDLPLASPAGQELDGKPIAQASAAVPVPNDASRPRPMPPAPAASVTATGGNVTVETIGPAVINLGSPLTYEVVARNGTGSALSNVRVENQLPPGARVLGAQPRAEFFANRLAWTVGTLEAGGERRFQVQVQPAGEGELRTCSTVTFSTSGCLQTLVAQPKLVLSKTGPERVVVGEPAVFQLEITNTGNAPANGVVLHDRLPPGLRHERGPAVDADLGAIAPGETRRVTLATKAVRAGQQTNQASVTAENAATVSAEATVLVTEPALALRKTGPRSRFLDREAEFDIEVSNPGNGPAKNVQVVDVLPPGLTFLEAGGQGIYSPEKGTVTWNLGTLPPGARRGLSVKVLGKTPGDFTNRAVAKGDVDLSATADATVHVEGVPALLLEVVDLDDPVEVGAETTYEIRVINQGTCASQGLQIIAIVPDGMTPRDATGPAPYHVHGQQVIFEPVPLLAPRADALYRVRVACRTAGDWRFKVEMKCDQFKAPVHEEESTRIYKD